jgi:hypothetical protein
VGSGFRDRWRVRASYWPRPIARRARNFCGVALVGSICLSAAPAVAIDGTWTGTTNSDWNTDTNWSPGPTPTNTASFANNGAPTSVSIGNLTSINTIQFLAGAPTYSFTFVNGPIFNINGLGIINNSSNAPIFGPGEVFFRNSSTAGNAIFFSAVDFFDSSNAGNANLAVGAEFNNSSNAGNDHNNQQRRPVYFCR